MVIKKRMTPIGLALAAVLAISWLLQPLGIGAQGAAMPRATVEILMHDLTPGNERLARYASNGLFPSAGAMNVELLGQIGGNTYAVDVKGSHAYIGVGARLIVLNITDPARPTVVGQTSVLPGVIHSLAVVGSHAYIAAGLAGLRVIDIADPTAPTEIGFYDTPGDTWGVAVGEDRVYVADGYAGLRIINVANPVAPVLIGYYKTPDYAISVAIAGSHIYVADGLAGLRILDVANPSAPREIGFYGVSDYAHGLTMVGDYVYLADKNAGLRIINVATPTAPVEVGFYDTPGHARNVAVAASYAYVADDVAGLQVIDVANPAMPTKIASHDTPGAAHNVVVAGGYAYIADYDAGLRVVNVTNPEAPIEVGFHHTPGAAHGVAGTAAYAYVASRGKGLRIINVADPAAPVEIGSYDTPGQAIGLAAAGNYIYVADDRAGLRVIDVTTPTVPVEVGHHDTPDSVQNVALIGRYAYVAAGLSGLRVIDVANPAAPVEIGFYDTSGYAEGVAVAGNYAYIADGNSGLRVINIANPAAPFEVGFHETPKYANNIAVDGGYVYIAAVEAGLRIINVSNPSAPMEVGDYRTPGWAMGVAVASGYVYIADGYGGLRVINVMNPTAPVEAGHYDTPGWGQNVAVAGSLAYIADEDAGLWILRFIGEPTPTLTSTSTPTPTPTWTHTPTPTHTYTPTPTKTFTPLAPTPTWTPTPDDTGDLYEPDDTCVLARFIPTDGTDQQHTFHRQADEDWVAFQAVAGTRYLIQGQIPAGSPADLTLVPYPRCSGVPGQGQNYTFTPGVRLEWLATTTGPIYLRLLNHNASVFGPHVSYHLSIRTLSDTPASAGALILVAGKLREGDPLQAHIHNVTDRINRVFLGHGYTPDRIFYMATDPGRPGWDALPTHDDLEAAITDWAAAKVGPDRPLTLYMVDHGDYDNFPLDQTRGHTVSVAELDGWLAELEAARPGVKINVIVEACYSGSFIDLPKKISRQGRVVITSTSAHNVAYASPTGAIFSDYFISALDRGDSLYGALQNSTWAVRAIYPDQQPWLDDNGNGMPNEASDGTEAQRRGFTYVGTLSDTRWPPYIAEVQTPSVVAGQGLIRARVLDDKAVKSVWVVIYPPSWTPPPPGQQLVGDNLPSLPLTDQGNGWYGVNYAGFAERGAYRMVVYAQDWEGLDAQPVSTATTVQAIYLPLVIG